MTRSSSPLILFVCDFFLSNIKSKKNTEFQILRVQFGSADNRMQCLRGNFNDNMKQVMPS